MQKKDLFALAFPRIKVQQQSLQQDKAAEDLGEIPFCAHNVIFT
jgi:hypothetical protein